MVGRRVPSPSKTHTMGKNSKKRRVKVCADMNKKVRQANGHYKVAMCDYLYKTLGGTKKIKKYMQLRKNSKYIKICC